MLWALLITLGLIKLAAACLMLWLPFRYDSAMVDRGDPPPPSDSSGADEDGGSKVPEPGSEPHPRRPLPRLPRRGGPHGSPARGPRPRVRVVARTGRRGSPVSR